MNDSLKDKVVIVTGGTSGIGRVTAVAFGKQGAKVVVSGRREKEGADAVAEIKAAGGEGMFVRTDVAVEEDVRTLVEKTVAAYGRLDFAFNNAGIVADRGPITEATGEIFDQTFNVNVRGIVHGMKYQIPAMLKNGGGAIVNNASALGLSVIPNAALYNASKFAVIGLTKSAAVEFAAQGVRVNAVCPAVVETEINATMRDDPKGKAALLAMHPIGRFGKAEEIAAAVLFLCTPGAGFITGIAMPIDGGWTAQ